MYAARGVRARRLVTLLHPHPRGGVGRRVQRGERRVALHHREANRWLRRALAQHRLRRAQRHRIGRRRTECRLVERGSAAAAVAVACALDGALGTHPPVVSVHEGDAAAGRRIVQVHLSSEERARRHQFRQPLGRQQPRPRSVVGADGVVVRGGVAVAVRPVNEPQVVVDEIGALPRRTHQRGLDESLIRHVREL